MKRYDRFMGIIVLIFLSAVAYLPLVKTFGYTNDDWYLMYSAGTHGPSVFQSIFSVDRPGRVLVMIPAYRLFGDNPLYYNLSAYVFRVLGALALLWVLNLLWARRQALTTAMALLFLIYPGFLSQPNAIDYQSHIVGLAAALISIWLTLLAVRSENRMQKLLFHSASILFGWLYLSQMEWYIGFEFFRWACVFILASRSNGTLLQKTVQTIKWAYPSLLVPLAFLIWRLLFFVSERGATDVDVQLDLFKLYPIQTIYHWSVQVAQDLFDVMFAAWVMPLSQLTGAVQRWGGVLAILSAGLVIFALSKLESDFAGDAADEPQVTREALWLGLLTAVIGLIPIAMVNRDVSFPAYSRYSLVSSAGVAIFLVAALSTMRFRILRNSALGLLVLIALLTHHANSVKFSREAAALRNYWWQVAWRIPQLEPRTTLIGYYPVGAIEEDYFIWGPANLIYYPQKQTTEGIQPTLFAAVLNRDAVIKILSKERQEFDNRKNIITYKNYRNIIILSQPSVNSCVHVINGLQPEFSQQELDSIRVTAPFSETEHILVDKAPHTPPTVVFGPEPDHGWCYYYQKADLARQRGDWDEVLKVGDEAFGQNLAPADGIEWMPFLQAYAITGNVDRLTELAPQITSSPYIARQACQIIESMPNVAESVVEAVKSLYCAE